jgi:hypothetical protein
VGLHSETGPDQNKIFDTLCFARLISHAHFQQQLIIEILTTLLQGNNRINARQMPLEREFPSTQNIHG